MPKLAEEQDRVLLGLRGRRNVASGHRGLPGSDSVLSVFENVGLAHARVRSLGGRDLSIRCSHAGSPRDVQQRRSWQLRPIRRFPRSETRLAVFSPNQAALLSEWLEIPNCRLSVVPFVWTPASTTHHLWRDNLGAALSGGGQRFTG